MLDCQQTVKKLRTLGVNFFTGVPDSLLQDFCACVCENSQEQQHVTAANEGGGIALAAGHYLATGHCALVYMQNSGLGNAINPLLSLTDPAVYSIPMLLFIGWRGEPGGKDEPQHVRQGELTLPLLTSMGIPYFVLPSVQEEADRCVQQAHARALKESKPVAVVVKKGTFLSYEKCTHLQKEGEWLLREQALEVILSHVDERAAVVCTTGKTSREVFEIRERENPEKHQQDFLTVGSMGHCSQIALGLAMTQPERKVWCLDGDGSVLMHMGGMALVGQSKAHNLVHVVLNNGAHESVGGQKTVGHAIDFCRAAKAMGYRHVMHCENFSSLDNVLHEAVHTEGPIFVEVKLTVGSRSDLGRPSLSPQENKAKLMNHLQR